MAENTIRLEFIFNDHTSQPYEMTSEQARTAMANFKDVYSSTVAVPDENRYVYLNKRFIFSMHIIDISTKRL